MENDTRERYTSSTPPLYQESRKVRSWWEDFYKVREWILWEDLSEIGTVMFRRREKK